MSNVTPDQIGRAELTDPQAIFTFYVCSLLVIPPKREYNSGYVTAEIAFIFSAPQVFLLPSDHTSYYIVHVHSADLPED